MGDMAPTTGPAWRAAEVRAADFERLGFRAPFTGLASAKHAGFKPGEIIVSARAPCGRIIRAGLTGPIQPCGARCGCIKGERA